MVKEITKTLRELYECKEMIKIEDGVITPSLIRRAVRGNCSIDNINLDSRVRLSTQYNPDRREISIYLGQIAHIGKENYRDVWLLIKKT
jgi:hypothetical protein